MGQEGDKGESSISKKLLPCSGLEGQREDGVTRAQKPSRLLGSRATVETEQER